MEFLRDSFSRTHVGQAVAGASFFAGTAVVFGGKYMIAKWKFEMGNRNRHFQLLGPALTRAPILSAFPNWTREQLQQGLERRMDSSCSNEVQQVEEFRVYVYFNDSSTRENGLRMRQILQQEKDAETSYRNKWPSSRYAMDLQFGPVVEQSQNVEWGYYEILVRKQELHELLTFLMFQHRKNSVLIVPIALGEVYNHTERALWLGDKVPVNMDTHNEADTTVKNKLRKLLNAAEKDQ